MANAIKKKKGDGKYATWVVYLACHAKWLKRRTIEI